MRVMLGTAVGVLLGIQACDGESATAVTSTTLPCSSSTTAGSARRGLYVQARKGGATTTITKSSKFCSNDDSRSSKGSSGNETGIANLRRHAATRVRGGAVVSDPYHARMQVMITRNMRKVLVEELDYLPDEVDDMDPQIAAVVIEKSLPRPRAGMPIVWRRSIRHKESTSNPVSALTKALRGAAGGVLKGVANVLAFPLRLVKEGRSAVSLVVAAAAVLALVAASSTESSEGMDGEGASPGLTGLRLLEDKLCDAKALLWRVGRRAGGGEQEQVEEEKKEEARQGNRWTNKYFGKGRGVGDDSSRPLDSSATTASRTPPSSSSRSAESSGVNRERKFREISDGATRTDSSTDDGREKEDEEGTSVAHSRRGASAAIEKNAEPGIENGNGMIGSGGGGARDAAVVASGELHENVAVAGAGSVGGGGVERRGGDKASSYGMLGRELHEGGEGVSPANSGRRKNQDGGRRRGEEGYGGGRLDANETCPDAPVGPGSGSAVWFEDLPPANPAPSTIGVLDEDEESQGMEDDRPRWGRKPMSEHIPDEEEMEAWESKIKASDTWLDKGINRAMANFFGGGKGHD